jgi:hypothetical protein
MPSLQKVRRAHEALGAMGTEFQAFEINRFRLEPVTLNFASWNRVVLWLRAVDELRRAA